MKKQYLRKKFSLLFAGVFFCLLVLMWVGDSFFLEGFYEKRKETVLRTAYIEMNRYLESGKSFADSFPSEELHCPSHGNGKYLRHSDGQQQLAFLYVLCEFRCAFETTFLVYPRERRGEEKSPFSGR